MTEPTLAELAETTGFKVFKLEAAGIFLGVVVGVVVGTGDTGWQPMQTWFTYSVAVTAAGAIIGSVGGLGRSKARPARPVRSTLAAVAQDTTAAVAETPLAIRQRPEISAFRATRKVSSVTLR